MKKLIFVLIVVCVGTALCGSSIDSRSISTTENAISTGDDFAFYTNAKLYYKEGGSWKYYGTYPVYFNRADKEDGCNQWVRFGEYSWSPAEYHGNKRLQWPRRVKWQGVYLYF